MHIINTNIVTTNYNVQKQGTNQDENDKTLSKKQSSDSTYTTNEDNCLLIQDMTLEEINAISMQSGMINENNIGDSTKNTYSYEYLKSEGFGAHYLIALYFNKTTDLNGNEIFSLKSPLSVSGQNITDLTTLRKTLNIKSFNDYLDLNCSDKSGSLLAYLNNSASSNGHLGKESDNNSQINSDTYNYSTFYDFLATSLSLCSGKNWENGGLYGHFHSNEICNMHLDEQALAVALVKGGYIEAKDRQQDVVDGVICGVKYDYTISEIDNAIMQFLNDLAKNLGKTTEELSIRDLVNYYCETQPGVKQELEKELYHKNLNDSAAFDVYGNFGYDRGSAGCDVASFFYKILGPANFGAGSIYDKLSEWICSQDTDKTERIETEYVRECIYDAAGINAAMSVEEKQKRIKQLCEKVSNEFNEQLYNLSDYMLFDYLVENNFVSQKTYTKSDLLEVYKFAENEIEKYFYIEGQDKNRQDIYKMRRDTALEEMNTTSSTLYDKWYETSNWLWENDQEYINYCKERGLAAWNKTDSSTHELNINAAIKYIKETNNKNLECQLLLKKYSNDIDSNPSVHNAANTTNSSIVVDDIKESSNTIEQEIIEFSSRRLKISMDESRTKYNTNGDVYEYNMIIDNDIHTLITAGSNLDEFLQSCGFKRTQGLSKSTMVYYKDFPTEDDKSTYRKYYYLETQGEETNRLKEITALRGNNLEDGQNHFAQIIKGSPEYTLILAREQGYTPYVDSYTNETINMFLKGNMRYRYDEETDSFIKYADILGNPVDTNINYSAKGYVFQSKEDAVLKMGLTTESLAADFVFREHWDNVPDGPSQKHYIWNETTRQMIELDGIWRFGFDEFTRRGLHINQKLVDKSHPYYADLCSAIDGYNLTETKGIYEKNGKRYKFNYEKDTFEPINNNSNIISTKTSSDDGLSKTESNYEEVPQIIINADIYTEKREKLAQRLGLFAVRNQNGIYMLNSNGHNKKYLYNPLSGHFELIPEEILSNKFKAFDRNNLIAIKLEAIIKAQQLGLNFTDNYPFVCEKDGQHYYFDKTTGEFNKH